MRVFIYDNFSWRDNPSGVQVFASNILQHLKDSELEVVSVCPPKAFNTGLLGILFTQIYLPFYLILRGSPLLITLTNISPIFYRNEYIVVHDLAALNGDWFKSYKYATYFKLILPIMLSYKRKIFTVSNTVSEELYRTYSLSKENIVVLGNSVSWSSSEEQKVINVLSDSGTKSPRPYVLMVGNIDPRKNVSLAIEIWSDPRLRDYDLVVVGGMNNIFNSSIEVEAVPQNVIFTGYVSRDILLSYYNNCTLFMNLSEYEGFGIPVLEALWLGRPVLLSDIPVYRELYSPWANYLKLENKENMIRSIVQVLLNSPKSLCSDKVEEIRSIYSWKLIADRLLKEI